MGEEPLLPGYRKSQTFYCLNCPEAPKPTSSSPAGRSTSLTLLKPRPRAHGPACSEGPHGSWGGGGVPHGQPCSCVEPGEAGWVLSHVARRDSKKDQILGHIGHPRSPILVMQAGRGWAVSGKVGMTSLLILSPKSPASPSQGARLRPWAWPPVNTTVLWTRSSCSWAPPSCSGPWDSVVCNDSPSEKGVAQRAQGTQPTSQPGQVTLYFSPQLITM